MKVRGLLKKIELKLRPLQLGEGQRVLDEADGLAEDDRASATEAAPTAWPTPGEEPDR